MDGGSGAVKRIAPELNSAPSTVATSVTSTSHSVATATVTSPHGSPGERERADGVIVTSIVGMLAGRNSPVWESATSTVVAGPLTRQTLTVAVSPSLLRTSKVTESGFGSG